MSARQTRGGAVPLVLALAALGPGDALAQSAQVNQFLFGAGAYGFSLSLAPNSGGGSAVDMVMPEVGWTSVPGTTVRRRFLADGGAVAPSPLPAAPSYMYELNQSNATTTAYAATFQGEGPAGISAPVGLGGNTYGGSYFAVVNDGSASAATSTRVREYFNAAEARAPQSATSLLWGSVEASNTLRLYLVNNYVELTGADILSAARSLGIDGNQGSYYVTVNALGGTTFDSFFAYTGTGTAFEFAPLQYSVTGIAPSGVTTAPGEQPGPVDGAPAPVLGATPSGGAIGLGLLGLFGVRRARRRGVASVA